MGVRAGLAEKLEITVHSMHARLKALIERNSMATLDYANAF
ncbi:hypothetical protein V1294_001383 [Bradyrhizobium sp. AZCC 1678]|jgi:hypothetical protein|uniref:HTH luxR-type domain-containing protein n=1 Tax=Bradyrhizobium algeriense TaxID=634784 RepID=A0ABU8BP72_9BRAD